MGKQMLKLSGKALSTWPKGGDHIFKLSTNPDLPEILRQQYAYLSRDTQNPPIGFAHYFYIGEPVSKLSENIGHTVLSTEFGYLNDSDIVRVTKEAYVRVLFRSSSDHNSILLTEQCNNYCLMCSQPPKRVNDIWLLDEVRKLIPLIPRHTQSIGITGGEPTLFGDDLIGVLRLLKSWLPNTSVHLLSNGRNFSDRGFAQKYASVGHSDLMVGIPIYSDDPARHDYVVQAKGAFDETIRGVLNLKRLNQKVEIRVVIHKQTFDRLPELAEFIARNLLFVDHVAIMGLEMTGFTLANLDSLWIDPFDYKDKLSQAVLTLQRYGVSTSVYNHQLCTVNHDVEPCYVKSISDWKNEYLPACSSCKRINECGGFFSSGIKTKYSDHIQPFNEIPAD